MSKEKNNEIKKCNLVGTIITLLLMIVTIVCIYLSDYSYKYYAFIAAFFELIIGLIIMSIIKNNIKTKE